MDKILLFGKQGRLGSALTRQYPEIIALSKADCDITNLQAVREVIKDISPDVVINCAVISDVNYCEQNPEKAWDVNVRGVRNIAEAARDANAYMLHFSSDYALHPINEYGWTKLASEGVVTDGLVIRTKFFDASYWLYSALASGKPVQLLTNTIMNPISIYSLLEYIAAIIEKRPLGLMNIGTREPVSHYDLGLELARKFNFDTNLITANETQPSNYKYPLDTFMNLDVLAQLGLKLISISDDIQHFKEKLSPKKGASLDPA